MDEKEKKARQQKLEYLRKVRNAVQSGSGGMTETGEIVDRKQVQKAIPLAPYGILNKMNKK